MPTTCGTGAKGGALAGTPARPRLAGALADHRALHALLASIPDSHVARKHGAAAAGALRQRARPLSRALWVATEPHRLTGELLALDRELKARGLNPGTTADLTVASHLALSLMREG